MPQLTFALSEPFEFHLLFPDPDSRLPIPPSSHSNLPHFHMPFRKIAK